MVFRYMIQATGHEKRLNRKGKYDVFQKPTYSEEELIIDIGTSMLCAHVGIHYGAVLQRYYEDYIIPNIEGWINTFENNSTLFFSAVIKAQKAVNYILN